MTYHSGRVNDIRSKMNFSKSDSLVMSIFNSRIIAALFMREALDDDRQIKGRWCTVTYLSEKVPLTKAFVNDVFPTARNPKTAILRVTKVGSPLLGILSIIASTLMQLQRMVPGS